MNLSPRPLALILSIFLVAGCNKSTTNPDLADTDHGVTNQGSVDFASPVPVGDSVLTHHKNTNRDGVYIQPALTKAAIASFNKDVNFTASLPGPNDHVYAQPLYFDAGANGKDLVIVATEGDNVYALDATSGAVVWTTPLGKPVPLASMPCGNIDPFGVTGTPAIDYATRTIYLSAMVTPDGAGATKQQLVFALSVDTGAVKSGWPVDIGAKATVNGLRFDVAHQGQRGALLVMGGVVYIPYGGLYGDCNPYHGWVVAIPENNPTHVTAWATPLPGGGMWMPGGVSTDGANLFVSTGNTFGATKDNHGNYIWGGGDAVIKFSPGPSLAAPIDSFAPANWETLDNTDEDLGAAPILFDLPGSTPSKLALAFGKDGNAYLLDRDHLGGVGAALHAMAGSSATLTVATDEIITAPALYTTNFATYVAFRGNGALCTGGTSGDLTTLKIVPGSPPTVAGSFCAVGGAGSPIVTTSDGRADAIIWTLGAEANNHLNAFDGDSGKPISFAGSSVNIPNMRRFNSAIAAKGRIFVPADNTVVAFTL